MKYQSKKNPEIIASLDFKEEKFKTVRLIYLTGTDAGKSVSITESTFKRWWKKYEEPAEPNSDGSITKSEEVVAPAKNSPLDCLNIDYNKVNEPYPEPNEQKYVKKPQSVIDYENHGKRYNTELPDFDNMVKLLNPVIKKINKGYIKLEDGTTIWRKSTIINIYAADKTWELLTFSGLKSRVNKDKDRPYAFDIKTLDEFNKVLDALINE